MTDDTHDPARTSWVESANILGGEFPIQNLPLGVVRPPSQSRTRPVAAIGEFALDLGAWLPGDTLAAYFALPVEQRRELRRQLVHALETGATRRDLYHRAACEHMLPTTAGDYTDFYASLDHANNVGRMFRPDNPLLPNYRHVPIAYHGRTSSLVVSGTPIRRPCGQLGEGKFGPTRELDYEVELGAILGPGNSFGEPIPVRQARDHLIGICLLNDWSARDIQRWEYQPLGPFLAKNFATTLSPWLVTAEALEPFRIAALSHETPVLPYLQECDVGAYDITVEAWLKTMTISKPFRLSQANFKDMYWTLGQMIAHHTVNGCPLRPGDVIGSGTISGPAKENRGCLLELTWKGTEPIELPGGEKRTFLEDGDELILTGFCQRAGCTRIGLGSCRGVILPPKE